MRMMKGAMMRMRMMMHLCHWQGDGGVRAWSVVLILRLMRGGLVGERPRDQWGVPQGPCTITMMQKTARQGAVRITSSTA